MPTAYDPEVQIISHVVAGAVSAAAISGVGENQGIAVSDRGRIPASVIEQDQAAAEGATSKVMSSSGLTGPRSAVWSRAKSAVSK